MKLVDYVRSIDGMRMVDEDGEEESLQLLPPISGDDLDTLRGALPCPLPNDVEELLRYSAGFANGPLDTFEFFGMPGEFGMEEILPHAVPVAHDGYGNYWVLDLAPDSTVWGPVLFACHDPAVLVVQAHTMEQFIRDVLEFANPPHQGPIHEVHDKHSVRIWGENPGVLTVPQCRASEDVELRDFAESLAADFLIVDLRHAALGDGFSWGRYGPRTVTRRHGTRPIFAYQPRSWFQRLLGR